MLILLVGLTSSGKSTAAKILEEMGFSVACSGDVIREEIRKRGLPYTKENDVKMAKWFNEQGENLVVERMLHRLKGDKIAIDGMRSPEMLQKLEEITGQKPVIVAIKADFGSRYQRECERMKFPDKSEEAMKKRDQAHIDIGARELIERADYTINNTSLTKGELRARLKEIIKNLEIKNI